MTFLLIVLILLAAAAGGYLGRLLELAAWLIVSLVVIGALIGAGIYVAIRRFWRKLGS